MRTKYVVDYANWSVAFGDNVAGLVGVAPHVDVAGRSVDPENVAEAVAVSVANVHKPAIARGFQNAAMIPPITWGLNIPARVET